MAKKLWIGTPVEINAYLVIWRAVEEGVAYGVRHAHKHTPAPTEDHISTEVENAVMNALCEVLKFDDE